MFCLPTKHEAVHPHLIIPAAHTELATHAVTGGAVVYTHAILKEKQKGSASSHSSTSERATSLSGPASKTTRLHFLLPGAPSKLSQKRPLLQLISQKDNQTHQFSVMFTQFFNSTHNGWQRSPACRTGSRHESPSSSPHITNLPLCPTSSTPEDKESSEVTWKTA